MLLIFSRVENFFKVFLFGGVKLHCISKSNGCIYNSQDMILFWQINRFCFFPHLGFFSLNKCWLLQESIYRNFTFLLTATYCKEQSFHHISLWVCYGLHTWIFREHSGYLFLSRYHKSCWNESLGLYHCCFHQLCILEWIPTSEFVVSEHDNM